MDVDDLRECLTALESAMSLTVPHSWAKREFKVVEDGELEPAVAAIAAECSCSWVSTIEGYSFEKQAAAGVPLSERDRRSAPVPLQ